MMVESAPSVSVLMSVYNAERYLREAIESILRQTWKDYEFLIVNDGSTDSSREIIAAFDDPRIRLFDNASNIGLTKSLNRGLELARGEFIARQDADDVSHPTRLEHQVSFLDAHPDVALLGARKQIINQYGHRISGPMSPVPLTALAVKWQLMFKNAFTHTSVMYRRKVVWDQMRGYDERFIRAQDFELWSRIAQKYAAVNLPQVLISYRKHSESIMARDQISNVWIVKVISANLTRFSGLSNVSDNWASLIHSLFTGKVEEPEKFIAVMDLIFARFCEIHSDAATDQEIRRLRADQMAQIACLSLPFRKMISIHAYVRAFLLDSMVIRRVSFPKYVVRLLGGKLLYRKLRDM